MGDFKGHVYPGACIALLALRWIYCIFYRYFLCQREKSFSGENGRKFKSSLCFPMRCLPHFPLEAAIWVVLDVIIIVGESITIMKISALMTLVQHVTITPFYLLAPSVVLLKHFRYKLFEGLEYAALILAQVVTVFVFLHHKHNKSPLENQLHANEVVSFCASILALAIEMKYRHSPMAAIFRAYTALVSGIYLAVIGFILYPLNGEPWPTDDHYYIEIVSLLFIWIYGIGIFATIFLCVIAKLVVRRMSAARVVGTLDFETGVRRKSADADSRYPNGDSIRLLNSTDEEI